MEQNVTDTPTCCKARLSAYFKTDYVVAVDLKRLWTLFMPLPTAFELLETWKQNLNFYSVVINSS